MLVFWFVLLATVFSIIVFVLVFVAGYLAISYVLKHIPANRKAAQPQEGIPIWVFSNGVHTDLCFPFQNEYFDWAGFVDVSMFKPDAYEWVAFGWGDKGFYLETPTWAELKPQVAFKAMFKLSESTMHISLYGAMHQPSEKWQKSVLVTPAQYKILVDYVQQSFAYDATGQIIPIPFVGLPAYDHLNDHFFEAVRRYHLFYTCNTWANNALKRAGIRTATWAPFAPAVFHHL
ncbi:MAG TPA: TIGR02117 family protein [Microscillaceae bacterium]|jgi:uncharacterized protein (TIGR02117 family)|nr:TIGR02117 family protein [Microscillaceae bacterium]